MKAEADVKTTFIGPIGDSIATCMRSGKTTVTSTGGEASSADCCSILARMACTDFNFAAPPMDSATFATSALPSGFEATGAPGGAIGEPSALFSPGGGGMVMSTFVTGPSAD